MATVTAAYKRAIVAQKYSEKFVSGKSDAEIAAIYQRLLNEKQPATPKQKPGYNKEDRT